MIAIPFCVPKILNSEGFHNTWLPKKLREILLSAFLVLLFLGWQFAARYLSPWSLPRQATLIFLSTTQVLWLGCLHIVMVPVAEELFYRGYVLNEFEKVTKSTWALVLQAGLFSVAHIPALGVVAIKTFVDGLIFGLWRQRARLLLPLIIAHILGNAFAHLPGLRANYDVAREMDDRPVFTREVEMLSRQPVEVAMPKMFQILSGKDETVERGAVAILVEYYYYYGKDCLPYVKEALSKDDPKIVEGALHVIAVADIKEMAPQVRSLIVWSTDLRIQAGGILTLGYLGDIEGLRHIAEVHKVEKVRQLATRKIAECSGVAQESALKPSSNNKGKRP